jgi:hypothetical protein
VMANIVYVPVAMNPTMVRNMKVRSPTIVK